MNAPKTLQEAIQFFGDVNNCRQFMLAARWPDGKIRCPYCGIEKVTYLEKARLYRCYGDHPKQKFSLKVGTVFEDSPIPLEKWLPAVWMLVNCRNGVSSYEIHRDLGATKKSARLMLHRIRLAMQSGSFRKMGGPGGEIEADEAFVGGKAKNMHGKRRAALREAQNACLQGDTRMLNKAAVVGLLDRDQRKVRAAVVPRINREVLQAEILKHVAHGSKIYTDEAKYIWSLLKRGLHGTYVAVEPFHLFRYVDEQVFRFNNRKHEDDSPKTDAERFALALSQIAGKRLTYAEVTGKVGETTPF